MNNGEPMHMESGEDLMASRQKNTAAKASDRDDFCGGRISQSWLKIGRP